MGNKICWLWVMAWKARKEQGPLEGGGELEVIIFCPAPTNTLEEDNNRMVLVPAQDVISVPILGVRLSGRAVRIEES